MSKSNGSKAMVWTGRVLSGLVTLMILGGAIFGLLNPKMMREGMIDKYGYPENSMRWLIIAELACGVLYLVPQTAVLGAILLTGYLGGATATHVRAGEPNWFLPVIVGVVAWLGLFLRDHRVRELTLLRSI